MRYHVKGLATAEENLRYLLYMIEKGVQLAREASNHQLIQKHIKSVLFTIEEVWQNQMKSQRKV